MSRPNTYEQRLLSKAKNLLDSFSPEFERQMQVIENCALLTTGIPVQEYWDMLGVNIPIKDRGVVLEEARTLRRLIEKTEIPLPLAISSLMRKPIPVSEQKKEGAFYTDFRLAGFIAEECKDILKKESTVADIAAGTGILLASIAIVYNKQYPESFNSWISKQVFAFDLSKDALRGGLAAIASLSSSMEAVRNMWDNWRQLDSLTTDYFDETQYDIVVGNPPWGKIKLTRHQFSLEKGMDHTYGSLFQDIDESSYEDARKERSDYASALKEKYSLLGTSETDYYIAFVEKALSLLAPNGRLIYIVPAGVIRSQGTYAIRERVFYHYSNVTVSLFDNKESYFSIDSRFKFIVLNLNNISKARTHINFRNYKETSIFSARKIIQIDIEKLSRYRKDLTLPEVSSKEELDLFFKISEGSLEAPRREFSVCREVDMTNDRPYFEKTQGNNSIPVIEGRMVQPYRVGAKKYISGSGRRALWEPCEEGIVPQYYISIGNLSPEVQKRICKKRVGYCDIAGQTNERSMMAAIIPEQVVCGNKVPTVLFEGERAEDYLYLWLGVANSIVFDWLLRRVLTTTVNYFLLWSIPFPNMSIDSPISARIIHNARVLSEMRKDYYTNDIMGVCRAENDVLVAKAYGLSFDDLKLILNDFPLLDRGQVALAGKESVTKALIMSIAETDYKQHETLNRFLSNQLYGMGAKPFILSEMKQFSNMPDVLIVVYKEIVRGDIDKFTATSNIADTGGGARDLRFSPSSEFHPIFQRMFPDTNGGMNVGKFYWEGGKTTDVKIAAPTQSRANEMRVCSINQCFPPEYYPSNADDCILLFIYDSQRRVHPFFTSRASLKNDDWHPEIRSRILQGLAAKRSSKQAAMGFLDFENDKYYTNGKISRDY